jgi:diaminohydroxyphosphoribosylaminopyrimidine deaminase/5-amino-6-(5-phosphoribosylamino)uracil reductase
MTGQEKHEFFMRRALELAQRGSGYVSPNPQVGCVIVRDGQIIAEGYHHRYGDVHAEVDALRNLTDSAEGATLYVNLEPCTHHGKQPPCTEAIIQSGIRRVVIGMIDPHPIVSGRGIEQLQRAGIDTTSGILEQECTFLNRRFSHWATTGQPHVTLKIATSIDARAAMPDHGDRYLTCEGSRRRVHELRATLDGVMIGVGTAIADNPDLTVRLCEGRNPIRIIIDPTCRLPTTTRIVMTAAEIRTIILCSNQADSASITELEHCGIEVIQLPTDDGLVLASSDIITSLASRNIASILLEGGPYLASRLLRDDVLQEIEVHTAPFIIGSGPRWFADSGFQNWLLHDTKRVGPDLHSLYVRA